MGKRFGSFCGDNGIFGTACPAVNFKKHKMQKLFPPTPVDAKNAGNSHVFHCIINLNFK